MQSTTYSGKVYEVLFKTKKKQNNFLFKKIKYILKVINFLDFKHHKN